MSTRPFSTHHLTLTYVLLMLSLVGIGLTFPIAFKNFFTRPDLYIHFKFIHIVSVTLVFANAVIGTFWETRALLSKDLKIIRYTYKTVTWLDAVFTSPLILLSVLSGIFLGTSIGGVWTIGWLSTAFVTFMFCGIVWILIDMPSQYKIKRYFLILSKDETTIPQELNRLLYFRLKLNLFTLIPLLFIFYLMVHKPELKPIAQWF